MNYPNSDRSNMESYLEFLLSGLCPEYVAVLEGENVYRCFIVRLLDPMMGAKPSTNWKNPSCCSEQGSYLGARNTHHLDLVKVGEWAR